MNEKTPYLYRSKTFEEKDPDSASTVIWEKFIPAPDAEEAVAAWENILAVVEHYTEDQANMRRRLHFEAGNWAEAAFWATIATWKRKHP